MDDFLKKNLNASRPSEHPTHRGKISKLTCLKKNLNAFRPSELCHRNFFSCKDKLRSDFSLNNNLLRHLGPTKKFDTDSPDGVGAGNCASVPEWLLLLLLIV